MARLAAVLAISYLIFLAIIANLTRVKTAPVTAVIPYCNDPRLETITSFEVCELIPQKYRI